MRLCLSADKLKRLMLKPSESPRSFVSMPKLLGGYHLWQSQDDNCTAPIDLTDKKIIQIRRCEWEIFHIQLM